jgi:hypothetical protein
MATATHVGPIGIDRINNTLYVLGGSAGFTTIQAAVTYASTYLGSTIVEIVPGHNDGDSVAAVTGGAAEIFIFDRREGQLQQFVWNGTQYVPDDFIQAGSITTTNNCAGNTTAPIEGLKITWNLLNGTGETDFINSGFQGAGGFAWFNAASDTDLDKDTAWLMYLDANANLHVVGVLTANAAQITGSNAAPKANAMLLQESGGIGYIAACGPNPGTNGELQLRVCASDGSNAIDVLQLQGTGDANFINNLVVDGTLDATSCNVDNSPVRTFANTPDAPEGPTYPPAGIGVSTGAAWSPTSINPATVPRTNTANTFTADQTINGGTLNVEGVATTYALQVGAAISPIAFDRPGVNIGMMADNASPAISMYGGHGVANEEWWQMYAFAGQLLWSVVDDAGTLTPFMQVSRTASTVNQIALTAPLITSTGTGTFNDSLNVIRRLCIGGTNGGYAPNEFTIDLLANNGTAYISNFGPDTSTIATTVFRVANSDGSNYSDALNVTSTGISVSGAITASSDITAATAVFASDVAANGTLLYLGQSISSHPQPKALLFQQDAANNGFSIQGITNGVGYNQTLQLNPAGGTVQCGGNLSVGLNGDFQVVVGSSIACWQHLTCNVGLDVTAGSKNFRIPHPLDATKDLVHSCIEGPEVAVFYRGEGETMSGKATISLPDYFEALTKPDNRSVQLTLLVDDENPVFGGQIAAGRVKDGAFKVYSTDPAVKFYWEVKAERADVSIEVVTDRKSEAPAPSPFQPVAQGASPDVI